MRYPLWVLGAATLVLAQAVLVTGPHSRLIGVTGALAALAGAALSLMAVARKTVDPWRTRWERDGAAIGRGWLVGMAIALIGGVVTFLVALSGFGGEPLIEPGLVWLITGVLALAGAGVISFRRGRTDRYYDAALSGLLVAGVWLAFSLALALRGGSVWAEQGVLIWGGLAYLALSALMLRSVRLNGTWAAAATAAAGVAVVLLFLLVSLRPGAGRATEERPKPVPTARP